VTDRHLFSRFVEPVFWACILLVLALFCHRFRPTPLSNDGYQYLNVAEHLRAGDGPVTSLIYFETERSHRRIPAPLTTFPPGYPVAIAAVSSLSIPPESAARLISACCVSILAALLVVALRLVEAGLLIRQVLLTFWATNAVVIEFADSISTEPLFTLLVFSAVYLLAWLESNWQSLSSLQILVAGLSAFSLAGLSYWVRYAGIFVIVAFVLYALVFLAWPRNANSFLYFYFLWPTGLFLITLMYRNWSLVGTWRGGNNKTVHNPVVGVLIDSVRAHYHVFLGQHAFTVGLWELVLLVSLVVLLGLFAVHSKQIFQLFTIRIGTIALVCCAIYYAGLTYAGISTVISFGTRMFVPMLPLYIFLGGWLLSGLVRTFPEGNLQTVLCVTLVCLVVGYAGVNARDFNEAQPPAQHELLASLYADPGTEQLSLKEWIDRHARADEVLVATDAQAAGFLLAHPTVGLTSTHFGSKLWNCESVKALMANFNARFLILHRQTIPPREALLDESIFLAEAANGTPPCQFKTQFENKDLRVLRLPPYDTTKP
jgi:hypothetical protein